MSKFIFIDALHRVLPATHRYNSANGISTLCSRVPNRYKLWISPYGRLHSRISQQVQFLGTITHPCDPLSMPNFTVIVTACLFCEVNKKQKIRPPSWAADTLPTILTVIMMPTTATWRDVGLLASSAEGATSATSELFMAALCNRAGHIYFHPVVCSSFFFFLSFLAKSQPSQIGCVPYTSTHGVALVRI